MKRFLSGIAALLAFAVPTVAAAGSSEATATHLPIEEVAAFATGVERDLATRGAQVAIVARVGRDPDTLPEGLSYTHVAYWVYSRIHKDDGTITTGYRVYNLYQIDGDLTRSRLVQDSPTDFFAGAYALDAGIIVPKPALQAKILSVIDGPTYSALHNPRYAVLANPASKVYQNCTEHTLDVLMASLYDTGDRDRIKANIAAHFEAQPIAVSRVKRYLAPAMSAALVTSDHGEEIRTATFGSIGRFMQRYDLSDDTYRIASPTRL